MEKELFDSYVKDFFKALKEKTLLIIIDSKSKGSTAVFSLVSFVKKHDAYYGYKDYAPMLKELGFKQINNESLFSTGCSGRFALYILYNIGQELRGHGVRLPKDWNSWIQSQNHI
jgi:hypothetical protein